MQQFQTVTEALYAVDRMLRVGRRPKAAKVNGVWRVWEERDRCLIYTPGMNRRDLKNVSG